jgi:hypothetical protein
MRTTETGEMKVRDRGQSLLWAGLLMQVMVWYFPTQRVVMGNESGDTLADYLMLVAMMLAPGFLMFRALGGPENGLDKTSRLGWVLHVGGVLGMMAVMGGLWVAETVGWFGWAWGYRLMQGAGILGAIGVGGLWKWSEGQSVRKMAATSSLVSLVAIVSMVWLMRPYFWGATGVYPQGNWDDSMRVGMALVLSAGLMVLFVDFKARGRGEQDIEVKCEEPGVPGVVERVLGMAVLGLGVVITLAWGWRPMGNFGVSYGWSVGPWSLWAVAAQTVTGLWVVRWMKKNRRRQMGWLMYAALGWRYAWFALLGALGIGFLVAIVMAGVCAAITGTNIWSIAFPWVSLLVSIGTLGGYVWVWRRLRGRKVFDFLWPMAWGEFAFGVIVVGWEMHSAQRAHS